MVGLEKSVELVELVGLDGVARGWRGGKRGRSVGRNTVEGKESNDRHEDRGQN